MDFTYSLIEWYLRHRRDLPWRRTDNPYLIWISEVILQQTRVEQGMAYYHRFTGRFPDIESLAIADEEEVMKMWQGLGYYTRARNLHQAAKTLWFEHHAKFPDTYREIIKLKGIGDYSASAISSIAFKKVHPVIDGNVIRVISRYNGIRDPVNSAVSKRKIRHFLDRKIDHDDPGTFNQAVMELGALVCKPKSPKCTACPLMKTCKGYKLGNPEEFPVKTGAKLQETRYFNYLVIFSFVDDVPFVWLNKRNEQDIWKNLYDFPLVETSFYGSPDEIRDSPAWKAIQGSCQFNFGQTVEPAPYKLSHRQLVTRFMLIRSDDFNHQDYVKVKFDDHHKYPVSRMIENFLKKVESRPGIFLKFPD